MFEAYRKAVRHVRISDVVARNVLDSIMHALDGKERRRHVARYQPHNLRKKTNITSCSTNKGAESGSNENGDNGSSDGGGAGSSNGDDGGGDDPDSDGVTFVINYYQYIDITITCNEQGAKSRTPLTEEIRKLLLSVLASVITAAILGGISMLL